MKKSRLEEHYQEEVKPRLQEKFAYKNPMQIPRLRKIVISMGLAEASKDKHLIDYCLEDLRKLSGQKAIATKSKKAISNFKLREGQVIGAKVTLRGHRMYDFMYRFEHICAPKLPDFRGFKKKADGRGSYSLGIKDQTIFPEIDLDKVKCAQGMNITFVTSAETDEECLELLRLMGMPLKSK
ncbi:MAG: 50S ribosomal protein L5 [Chlamydiae bacterium]|jgi:large subunit ribosomal protein L5|nr:50S ribosomal protein L5 [Chlamydiota bacterium]